LSHVLSRKKLHHRNVLVITLPIIDRRSEFVHWHTICWRSRSWVIVKDPATPEICDRSLMFIVSLFLDVHATCLWLFTCRIYYATPASSLLDANVFRTAAVKDICHNVNVEYTSTLCPKKSHILLSISLPNINRYSKFFHWHTLWTTGNNVVTLAVSLRYLVKYKCKN